MKDTSSSDVLAKLQQIQDQLSEEYDLSLVLIDCNDNEITLPSKLPAECCKAENEGMQCSGFRRQLIKEANHSADASIHCCPYGLYVNIHLTGLAPRSNPIYLVSGRTKKIQELKKRLNLLLALYSLPLHWPEKISNINQSKRTEAQSKLTRQEIKILSFIAAGLSNKDMAYKLCISESTVKTHVAHILDKLSLENRTEAGIYALKNGLITRHDDE